MAAAGSGFAAFVSGLDPAGHCVPVGQASHRHRGVAVEDQPGAIRAGHDVDRLAPLRPACGRLDHQSGGVPDAVRAEARRHEPRKRQFDRLGIVDEIGGVIFLQGLEARKECRHRGFVRRIPVHATEWAGER